MANLILTQKKDKTLLALWTLAKRAEGTSQNHPHIQGNVISITNGKLGKHQSAYRQKSYEKSSNIVAGCKLFIHQS